MEMGENHIGHLFRFITNLPNLIADVLLVERLEEFQLRCMLVSQSIVDQYPAVATHNKKAAERHYTHIFFVHLILCRPVFFWYRTEHHTTITQERARLNDVK
ncbi:hypothetical protein SDC9_204409 [bioreactor metagenome]|uniref:Uncharacterized protein n=1 Tax=bioreactor metagenome TaxID=1076179 RepID=A0A645IZY6_9ZZZZ